ncbi:MAG: trigger factor family protein, partial [Bacteroidales bacterium]|nr:trigger factor family protein [Bacteroidales bacterium]
MQITQNKKDELNMSVSITLEQADYADDKKKKLNSFRRNAELKGFRKGMAPMSLVEKIYGGQALSEVLNEMVSDKMRGFIDENKLNILGEPLPAENQEERKPEDGVFTFTFDLGLAPEFTVDVTAEDKIPFYTIVINDKARADYRESLLKQIGSVKEGEDGKKELVAAEANQEAFDKLFGPDTVHNEEEFA